MILESIHRYIILFDPVVELTKAVGGLVGTEVGVAVGGFTGAFVGRFVGGLVGKAVGFFVGTGVGFAVVGFCVGKAVGGLVGLGVGGFVGNAVGTGVGLTGACVGGLEGVSSHSPKLPVKIEPKSPPWPSNTSLSPYKTLNEPVP